MPKFVIIVFAFVFLWGCGDTNDKEAAVAGMDTTKINTPYMNDCRSFFAEARKMDSSILQSVEINTNEANKAIKAFSDFSFYCATDTLAPVFLMKAGQIAQSINNLPQAKLCLEKVIQDFPNFRNRGAAMFLLAQLYDDPRMLNNEEKALEIYTNIINSYPGTQWDRDSRAAREMLGKSDEQIVEEFLKKNK